MKVNDKLVAFLFAIIPILGFYRIGIINIDIILLLFISILLLIKKYKKFEIKLFLILLSFLIIGIFSVISNIYSNNALFFNNTINVLFYSFLFCYIIKNVDKSCYQSYTFFLAFLSSIVIIIQFIGYTYFNTSLIFHLPLQIGKNEEYIPSIEWGRPNSIFLEPAHYAIYVLPVLYLALIKNKLKFSIFIILSILLSTSTTGFLISIILLIFFYIFKKRKIIIGSLFMILSILIYFGFEDFFLNISSKLDSDNVSSNIRVFGTLELIKYIIDNNFYLGLGLNQISSTIEGALNYANTYFMTFISYGILGVILLAIFIIYLYKINDNKIFLIILLMIMFSDQLLFNKNLFYLISTIYLFKSKKI